ncbi:hypothetical protein CBNV_gp049 [Clanis bilineata nucleopolyhedrovirus]|uniref:Uncharacterized protein n=1 Tax=Clanis bilineata nucleopolyhedrovirus TaxID=1307957 RepID=Q0N451_9ABAC|nr:hypothetical protein CBNV_gp049 [Clanis bilineata nucleopolyhedrovirus]ABF47392.1 hypothetical protein [Clanis bilineata nucleopolyhedrovirus]
MRYKRVSHFELRYKVTPHKSYLFNFYPYFVNFLMCMCEDVGNKIQKIHITKIYCYNFFYIHYFI